MQKTSHDLSDYIKPISGLEYYVLMKDYIRYGMGADVAPEYTRRQIVQEVHDTIERGYLIVHVKHIVGNDMQDVTHEIVAEALALKAEADAEMSAIDAINNRILASRDRARDYAKETVA